MSSKTVLWHVAAWLKQLTNLFASALLILVTVLMFDVAEVSFAKVLLAAGLTAVSAIATSAVRVAADS